MDRRPGCLVRAPCCPSMGLLLNTLAALEAHLNIEKSYEENDDGGVSLGVLGGASASLLFSPSVAVTGHWYDKRRALATGVACTAGGIGDVVLPVLILYPSPRRWDSPGRSALLRCGERWCWRWRA
ncbi:hypothetical protein MY8738_008132 [Beauveria namnaoensis]